jgi:hypothetical protein
MVRARSTTSESPYLPGLIQFGPYMANGTLVPYDQGDPWRCGLGEQIPVRLVHDHDVAAGPGGRASSGEIGCGA